MDSIPTPAYDLWDMRSIEVIHIEGGRGCPFNCKFCSTNIYFGRNYRLKDPKKLVEESVRVVKKYKVKHITFVHDNLFIKAKDCEEFCRVWCSRPELTNVHWACSLRVEVITKELVCEIAKSNCSGVFLGIESGSKRIQQIINKKIDPLAAKVAIETLQNHGIHSTTSFIIGFPEETESDLEQTLQFYGEMLRNPLTKPQASVLAVLPKSGYDHIDSSNLKYTGEISSMAHQGSVIPEDLLILIKESPDLFPSHHVPLLEYIGRDFIYECENFLKYVTGLYRWLIVMAIDCLGGNLKMLLDLWWDFVSEKGTTGDRFEYYSSIIFRKHFDEFMSSLMNNDKYSTKYRYIYKFLLQVYSSNNIRRNLAELSKKRNTPANVNTSTSFLRRKCTVETVSFSFRKIIDALSGKGNLQLVTEGTFYLIAYIHNEEIILEEPTELTLGVLNTIPNERRVDDILDELSSTYSHLLPEAQQHQISSRFAHALSVLSEQGVIEYC